MVKCLRYIKDFGTIQYKYSLKQGEPFSEINIKKRGVSHIAERDLQLLYSGPNKINPLKKKDIHDLFPLLHRESQSFFAKLITTADKTTDIDPDLIDSGDEDDE